VPGRPQGVGMNPSNPEYNFATNRGPTAYQWKAPVPAPAPAPSGPPSGPGGYSGAPAPTNPDAVNAYQQARSQQAFQWSQGSGAARAAALVRLAPPRPLPAPWQPLS
jgi:hypothetical protein